ncbi:hypothetical protein ACGFJ7_12560 [Actinoplanes sp. NPDC048988]|uniref:hypothetical protein n=1 Tax=Actinoplanes sp. NPDC048988 TaxID=3363901 RepID=UPI0037204EB1
MPAGVAASSSRHGGWRAVRLPARHRSTRLTMLLDLPFPPSIDALAAADPGPRYTVAQVWVDLPLMVRHLVCDGSSIETAS